MQGADIPYGSSLYDYFEPLSARAEAGRDARLRMIDSEASARCYRDGVKSKLTTLVDGSGIARGTTPPRVTGSFRKNGLLVDKVLLETRPGIFCAGLFMRKEGALLPCPGALGVCGHSQEGKGWEDYQRFAMGLALKGFAVFIFDPSGQGESHQFKPAKGATFEHSMTGKAWRSAGWLPAAVFVHDAQAALDYLLSRPEVKKGPVAVTGSSGGGQMSFFLFALDDRIGAAAVSCHMNTFRSVYRNETPTDAESTPEGLLAAGCDRPDFAIAGAPKPFLLMAAEEDFIDLRSMKKVDSQLAPIWKNLGKPENYRFVIAPGPHQYSRMHREAMYGFFTKHFLGREDAPEPEMELLTPEEYTVTPTGFVIDLPGALTENKALLRTLPETYPDAAKEIPAFLRQTLDLPDALPPAPDYRVIRNVSLTPETGAARYVLMPEPGSTARPVLMLAVRKDTPLIPAGKRAVLHCAHLSGRDELRKRVDEGNLFVLDVRGVGESRSTAGRSMPDDFFAPVGRESFMEGTGELFGRPLAGSRVKDLLGALALLREIGYEELTLSGRGLGGVLAAFAAAALELPVKRLILTEVPASLKALIARGAYRIPSSVLPRGMLKHFDFPELCAFLRTRYAAVISCTEDVPPNEG